MAVDVQNPKVTWATLFAIGTLIFYTGGVTYQVNKNLETNTTQWRYLNEVIDQANATDRYMAGFESTIKAFPSMQASNKELSNSLLALTYELKSSNERAERDKEDKVKADEFMLDLSNKINSIQLDVAGIKEQLKK